MRGESRRHETALVGGARWSAASGAALLTCLSRAAEGPASNIRLGLGRCGEWGRLRRRRARQARGDALGRHGEYAGVGTRRGVGSGGAASKCQRARGVGRYMAGGWLEYDMVVAVVRLRVGGTWERPSVAGAASGVGAVEGTSSAGVRAEGRGAVASACDGSGAELRRVGGGLEDLQGAGRAVAGGLQVDGATRGGAETSGAL